MKTVVDPEAVLETREAAAFYESCQNGLGKSFLTCIEEGMAEISRHPLLWRKIRGRYRRYLVNRFPYGLIYTVYKEIVYVVAVMHLRRKSGYWYNRVKDN